MGDTKVSRREVLKRGVVATAAGFGIPTIIPRHVLAAPGQPGANDRIGIGGIGIGRMGSGDISSANGTKLARIVAIADVNMPRAQAQAAKYGGEAYQDYRKMLERKDIDAIITATPEQWRILIVLHSCQAGKDLYVEKPMALTIREGRLMVEAVRKYGRVFQLGSQQRSQAQNLLGCELVRNGRIGKISKVIAYNYETPWDANLPAQPIPDGLDWDMWCGPAPLVPYNNDLYVPRAKPGWLSLRPYSGGEMTGWGSHGFDQIQWALGMDESGPIEVWPEGGKFEPPLYDQPESAARGNKLCAIPKVFYKYPGDIIMECANGPHGGGVFIGEKGKITIDRGKCVSDPVEIAQEPIGEKEIRLYKSTNHMMNWLECIKTREKPICDVEIGQRSGTVCHLGNIVRWAGRRLRWDPVKEEFIGDADANKYLDRERRKPYVLPETI